jgi:hypothetical protein
MIGDKSAGGEGRLNHLQITFLKLQWQQEHSDPVHHVHLFRLDLLDLLDLPSLNLDPPFLLQLEFPSRMPWLAPGIITLSIAQ